MTIANPTRGSTLLQTSDRRAGLAKLWRDSPSGTTAARIVREIDADPARLDLPTVRTTILRSFTVEPIVAWMRAAGIAAGLNILTRIGDFGGFAHELLDPSPIQCLSDVEIAIRVHVDAVGGEELPGLLVDYAEGRGAYPLVDAIEATAVDYHLEKFGPYVANPFTSGVDNATLRFVEATDGRGEGLGGIDLITEDRDAVIDAAKSRDCYVSDDEIAVAGLRMYLR